MVKKCMSNSLFFLLNILKSFKKKLVLNKG